MLSPESLDQTAVEPHGPSFEQMDCSCPTHGKYRAYRATDASVPVVNDCPACIDELETQRNAARRTKDAQQMRERKVREIFSLAGIPSRFASKSLDNYEAQTQGQQIAQAVCSLYAANWAEQYRKGGSLVLTGLPGTGKTHLACAIANKIMPEHLATVSFGTVSQILRGVRSTYGQKSERTETQALADLLKPDLLIADEVGSQLGTDHELQLLFEIFNGRYQNLRPTIVISNLNAQDLEKFLGQRVMDRFRECGSIVAFDWASHRGQQQDPA